MSHCPRQDVREALDWGGLCAEAQGDRSFSLRNGPWGARSCPPAAKWPEELAAAGRRRQKTGTAEGSAPVPQPPSPDAELCRFIRGNRELRICFGQWSLVRKENLARPHPPGLRAEASLPHPSLPAFPKTGSSCSSSWARLSCPGGRGRGDLPLHPSPCSLPSPTPGLASVVLPSVRAVKGRTRGCEACPLARLAAADAVLTQGDTEGASTGGHRPGRKQGPRSSTAFVQLSVSLGRQRLLCASRPQYLLPSSPGERPPLMWGCGVG